MLTNNIILILASLGLFQGIFLSIYLFTHKTGNKKLNVYLSLILLGLTIRIGKTILSYYMPLEAWQMNIGISGIFIVGPFLWLYGITLLKENKTLRHSFYLHLLPFILFISFVTIIPSKGDFDTFWNYGLVVLHLAIYLVISWVTLLKNGSKITLKKSKWYRSILIGVTSVWVYYLGNFLNYELHYIWGPIFYSFLIYAFTYLILNRNNFGLEKYDSSTLDRNNSEILFEKIKNLIEKENLFLQPTISLKTVSDKLSKNSREVSQSINENAQQNFREFINHYRIEKAKSLLNNLENKERKMAVVAYDSGFGTVTAFNVAFKKITGITPSAYRG
ncbi:AraC family transcriptional regulator [Maribacter sp. MAR_2009_72]|uniref:AraC family transcriptional regulator n=1 Tax=Maribacter sp. MAR_2009_72 TaxID=1250050 RepID=UPI00119AAEC3|nr:helix-turn-helix domain-containing protein [Maribacter sp. MAR_2009_72]TVZ15620.1 helix-turn-helix protein [Maribacter sp. MAR_2009_72]